MGKFQIQYLSKVSNHASLLMGADTAHGFVVVEERRVIEGGPFQYFLAWCSYFVLVFVALCVFIPNSQAHAAKMAHQDQSAIGLVKTNNAPADWVIRKSH